jgi:myo-inositol 2-dehydrogenase/D-chiro-inositol 1-dehydrogenase
VLEKVRELWPRLGTVRLIRLAQRLAPTTLAWQKDVAQTVGGSVLLTGVHLFDLTRWLTGSEFVSVDSRQRQVHNPVVEDQFLARAVLSDDCWASLEVSKHTQSRACIVEAVGDAGQLRADYLKGGVQWRSGNEEENFEVSALVPTLPVVLADWLDAINNNRPPPVTVQDGLATLQVVDACYRSAAAGTEVRINRA